MMTTPANMVDVGNALYRGDPLTNDQWNIFHDLLEAHDIVLDSSYARSWADVIALELGVQPQHGGSNRGALDTMIAVARGRM